MFPLSDDTPRRRRPYVTWGLILVSLLAFLGELAIGEDRLLVVIHLYGVVPARFTAPDWAAEMGYPSFGYVSFLTSGFLHAGWLHLAGNMWTLWIFGDNVEDRLGHARFLAFYLLCGVAACFAQLVADPDSTLPIVGASGSIAGVLGAYLLLFPRARILTVVPVLFYPLLFELPAVLYLGFWFLTQFFSGSFALAATEQEVGGIAWWAHVGGFVAGAVLLRFFLRPKPAPPQYGDDPFGRGHRWRGRWSD